MNMQRVSHYVRRSRQLGLQKSVKVVSNRFRTTLFELYWQREALNKRVAHSWSHMHKHTTLSFKQWFACNKKRRLSYRDDLYRKCGLAGAQLIQKADDFVAQRFSLLGSLEVTFTEMPWHRDFRLSQIDSDADCSFDPHRYYKDYTIENGPGAALVKDIKVPWELSRLQYLLVLGQAYEATGDEQYTQAFCEQVTDWFDKNPFLLGVNWVCPMEVGIRAVNMIWALQFFAASTQISESFWQRYVCSLYDHLFYLERNWEIYDSVTSNHYLADLIGYYYLCWFFQDFDGMRKRQDWCYQELYKEFEKQVFKEGTDYEGSTKYHVLVTEFFHHFYLLSIECDYSFPQKSFEKLGRMFSFIDWLKADSDAPVPCIGDNDSGVLLYYGLSTYGVSFEGSSESGAQLKVFPEFGLGIIKAEGWHVTVRGHAYQPLQVSGHFHSDVTSITVTLDGHPLVVDPGTYVYTPSALWRNHFRSTFSHNTVALDQCEPIPIHDKLFYMDIPYSSQHNAIGFDVQEKSISVRHMLYGNQYGITIQRLIQQKKDVLVITDTFFSNDDFCDQTRKLPVRSCWNVTLHPSIAVVIQDNSCYFYRNDSLIAELYSSDIGMQQADAWVALDGYGTLQRTSSLRSVKEGEHARSYEFFLYRR